jgi:hypothetical protein
MKKYSFLLLALAAFAGCTSSTDDRVNISGVYVREVTGEFGKGFDTVFITEQAAGSSLYAINHHVQFTRQGVGQSGTPTRKVIVLTGTWSPTARQLAEQRLGRVYSFPKKDEMYLGNSRYERIGQQ